MTIELDIGSRVTGCKLIINRDFGGCFVCVGFKGPSTSTERTLQTIDEHYESEISDLSGDDNNESDGTFESPSEQSSESGNSSSDVDTDDEPLSKLSSGKSDWKHGVFNPVIEDFTGADDDGDPRANWKPIDYMKQYLDGDFFSYISDCTNRHSVAVKGRNIKTTAAEIERFLGASIFMSCVGYPRMRMYWQRSLQLPLVCEVMTRDRYFRIRSSLKVVVDVDVSDDARKADRLWKVRPLVDRIRSGCLKLARPRDISIDEQMIPFSGACALRQYVPNKPNPVGLKNYVAASQDGLVLDYVVYQGSGSFTSAPPDLKLGMGACVIVHLAQTLPAGTRIYCDRFFMSPSIVDYMLTKHSMHMTGTVMKNRIRKVTKLSDDKTLMKRGRGASDSVVRTDGKVVAVKWYDNKPVVLISSVHGVSPQDTCKRWAKAEKKYVEVDRPAIVQQYNSKMGGVDLCDRMMSFYRMSARTRKWTIRTIMHFIDLAIVNSWFQYRSDEKVKGAANRDILQLIDFRLDIAQTYLAAHDEHLVDEAGEDSDENDENAENAASSRRRGCVVPLPPAALRLSQAKHLPEMTSGHSMRCRNRGCWAKTKVRCVSCKVHLCLVADRNCFREFHVSQ